MRTHKCGKTIWWLGIAVFWRAYSAAGPTAHWVAKNSTLLRKLQSSALGTSVVYPSIDAGV